MQVYGVRGDTYEVKGLLVGHVLSFHNTDPGNQT